MHLFLTIAVVLQVCSAVAIIVLVLLQHGKGADLGAAFGSGASGSLFGATGSANFLSRSTAVASTIFFCSTLAITFLGQPRKAPTTGGVLGTVTEETTKAPAQSPVQAPAAQGSTAAGAPQSEVPAKAPAENQIPR